MHDIWNPWHGCRKASEGCDRCYMFSNDRRRGLDPTEVRRSKTGFDYPLRRRRDGSLAVRPGELIRVCMNSDFFIEEADAWREEAWDIIRARPDVRFFLLTKRPERARACLPADWPGREGERGGWPNVMLNVSCENQRRANERIPQLLELPFAHRGIMCTPLIGAVSIAEATAGVDGPAFGPYGIEQVVAGGENYEDPRPCDFDWIRSLRRECEAADVTFAFIETGSVFVKDGRTYRLPSKRFQSWQAFKSGMSRQGRPIEWRLRYPLGMEVSAEELYRPSYGPQCAECGSRLICNGCAGCATCMQQLP